VKEALLVAAVLPELAERMETALRAQGEPRVADQVAALRITGPCTCGQSFCGSFQTLNTPLKRWFMRGRQIELRDGLPGEIVVDVVRGEIAYVEVLHLDHVRDTVARYASR
jgi:hypothetical protein